jgi:hypothetical protein
MAAQSYQIQINIRNATNKAEAARDAAGIFSSIMENAFAYGFTMEDVSYNSGTGFMRVRLSAPFPQAEVDSFNGQIIPV